MNTPGELTVLREFENPAESLKRRHIEDTRTVWKMTPRIQISFELPERKNVAQWLQTASAWSSQTQYALWIADRVYYAVQHLSESVEIDHDIRSGIPVLRGTRVPLSRIIAEVAEGESITEIAEDLELDVEVIRRFFEGFSVFMDRPFK